VLVACVREHAIDEPVPALSGYVAAHGVAPLHAAAVRHGVVGCLWTALRASGLAERPDAAPTREAYTSALGRHLRTLSDLELVLDVLGGHGIAPMVLRGPVLAEVVYRRPDLRGYADLDVLVAPRDFPAALAALERAGCVPRVDWLRAPDRMPGALRLATPAGTVLNLHWHVFGPRRLRAELPVNLVVVRARSRVVELAGRRVRTLDGLDTLVHLALQAALAGGDRLVWCKDIEQALLYRSVPDWDLVRARAEQWHAGPALALMLGRARRILGVPVPGPVLDALVPDPAWRALVRAADAVSPIRAGGRPSPARLVASAARGDGPASRRELARRVAAVLRRPPPVAAGPPGSGQRQPERDGATAASVGGAERRAYLDAVRRQM
jgi:hypothetical protein